MILNCLPKGWLRAPLKRFLSVSSGDMISADEETPDGYPIYGGNGIRGYTDKINTKAPALVIGRVGAKCGNVHLVETDFWASEHALVVYPRRKFDLRYGKYLLSALDLNQFAIRTAQPLINTDAVVTQIGSWPVEIKIQRRIADYLDRETARIDALIAEKEKMLALIEEKRTALISRAVTRGLDPNAPLKPSGLDWLGDIPAHWDVRRCATIFREIDERGEPDLPLLNVSLNTGVTRRVFSEDKIESVAADFSSYKVARKGMLVFNKMRFWQGAAGIAPIDGLTSPDYTVAEIVDAALPKYIEFVVRLPQFSNEVRRYSYGMVDDRLRLYWDSFKNIRIPIPPIDEQYRVLDYLDRELSGIDKISESIRMSINLIKERRASLITAAVTGQLDLKGLAA